MTERTFTQEEVDKIIADRIARERKKFSKDTIKTDVEVEKTTGMLELEKELNKRELLLDTKEALKARGLPIEMARMLVRDSAEETLENVKKFEKLFKEDIAKRLEELFPTPKTTVEEERVKEEIPLEVLAKKYTRRNR